MLRPPSFAPSSFFSLSSAFTSTPRLTPSPSRLLQRRASPSPHQPSFASPRYSRRRLYSTEANPSVHPQTPPPPPPPRSRLRRFVGFTSIAVLAFSAGLLYQTQRTVSRLMATPLISDAETLTAFTPEDARAAEVNEHLRTHPEANRLRADPDFEESRPHLRFPEAIRARSLTAGALSGPNKIVVPPFVFCEKEGKSMVSLMFLGSDICGHPGIIHGGMLATLLDEGFARCCFAALPNKVGVTANLNIDYRAPAMANSYVALRAKTVKVEGRKAWVEGRIETLPDDGKEPVVLVEAKALFIEPKQAAALTSLYRGVTE
ncbi:uncharacterized protein N7482_007308 [Penicillium canariense]|uniref:Thioesterase domain-containing protein n=1 Tax=Penicillium canariense TaxID=189055 RepID=A0A9W9HWJ4_9EURO|nr:uncharacterized protein N7482_007308 [Penicillium canariense]KAJ5160304.1 hypothetical protein N7482_007308 [Penicillium canariense]